MDNNSNNTIDMSKFNWGTTDFSTPEEEPSVAQPVMPNMQFSQPAAQGFNSTSVLNSTKSILQQAMEQGVNPQPQPQPQPQAAPQVPPQPQPQPQPQQQPQTQTQGGPTVLKQGSTYSDNKTTANKSEGTTSDVKKPVDHKLIVGIAAVGVVIIVIFLVMYIMPSLRASKQEAEDQESQESFDSQFDDLEWVEPVSTFSYTPEEIEMLRAAGYTGDEIESFVKQEIPAQQKYDEAAALQQKFVDSFYESVSDTSSSEFKDYVKDTWLLLDKRDTSDGVDVSNMFTYNTKVIADFEKVELHGAQLFIKVYPINLDHDFWMYVQLSPEKYNSLPASGNIILYFDYLTINQDGTFDPKTDIILSQSIDF